MASAPVSPRILRDPVHLLATGFGSGLVPRAPGTAGSLLALAPVWLMFDLPLPWRVAVALAVVVSGVWVCGESARRLAVHDHPAIVLDEIAAMLLLAVFLEPSVPWLLAALVLFRLFDIAKPWPIRAVDRSVSGGVGIMLDDVLAAAYAAICLVGIDFLV